MIAIGAAGILTACASPPGENPELVLSAVDEVPLPDPFPIIGLRMGPDNRLVMWARDRGELLVYQRGESVRLGGAHLRAPVGAGWVDGGEAIEAVDAQGREVVRLDLTGGLVSRKPLATTLVLDRAARAAEGWYVSGMDADRQYAIEYHPDGAPPRRIHSLPTVELTSGDSSVRREPTVGPVYLTPDGERVLLTLLRRGFTTVRLGGTEEEPLLDPLDNGLGVGKTLDEAARIWIALAPVALDRGYLQTLVDTQSDDRILLTFGPDGQPLRMKTTSVPLGFVDSDPATRRLAGVRRVGRTSVVIYQWRWSSNPTTERTT